MRKRIFLFSISSFIFYLASIIAGRLPQLIHGRFGLIEDSHTLSEWLEFIGDTIIYFLLALGIYLALCRYHPQKRYLHIALSVVIAFGLCFFAGLFWARLMEGFPLRMGQYFGRYVFPAAGEVFFAALFYLIRYSQYKELQQLDLQLQNREIELSFLRSQIDPHFLFNNLNNIYALVYEGSQQALPAISGLSELLRYMLYRNNETATIGQEVENMERYIALQQLRFEQPSNIHVKHDVLEPDLTIPPLLLIPFIENAFKHGNIRLDENWLEVMLESNQHGLNFSCRNLIGPKLISAVHGIGISNVKRRMELLYPNRHAFQIDENDRWFSIKLQIQYEK